MKFHFIDLSDVILKKRKLNAISALGILFFMGVCRPNEYKFNLSIKPSEQIYSGTVYLTYSNIPKDKHIILNCDQTIRIDSVKFKGQELQYMHNDILHTLHISCIFNEENAQGRIMIAISFTGFLNNDEKQGFIYIDDSTCALHLFPNFSSLFIPNDIMNECNAFHLYNISGNVVVEKADQIVISSFPFPQVSKFIREQKMFRFLAEEACPLPYFSMVIGNYTLFENQSSLPKMQTKLLLYYDENVESQNVNSFFSFLATSIFAIEKIFSLSTNCIQIVDVIDFPENESNTFGLIIFTPETLNSFTENKHFLIKQIIKQLLHLFPATANECWIIEGLSSYLAFVIVPLIDTFERNEFDFGSIMEVDIENYQLQCFRKALNSDNDPHGRSLNQTLSNLDDDVLFDPISIYKSTCLFKMLLHNKSFNDLRSVLGKLKVNEQISFTYEQFIESFQIESYFICYFNNPGYPILILDDNLTLHQTRFTLAKASDFLWTIPLVILVAEIHSSKNDESNSSHEKEQIKEIKTISFRLNKKEIDLTSILQQEGVDYHKENAFILINPFCESLCRIWYKGQWITKLAQYADTISSTKYRNSLFNVFIDLTALQDMGLIDKQILTHFHMFEIPRNIRKRFPLVRGNGSVLCSYQ